MQFQLTINVAAVALAVGGVLVAGESPLTPVQMLWVNMIMDSLASVALATEAPSDAMLRLRPFSSTTPLLTPSCVKHICGQARPPFSPLQYARSLHFVALDAGAARPRVRLNSLQQL